MLDNRIHYAQLAQEDRLRAFRQEAQLGRQAKRVFQIVPRRAGRSIGR
jgi:hypothetical protein